MKSFLLCSILSLLPLSNVLFAQSELKKFQKEYSLVVNQLDLDLSHPASGGMIGALAERYYVNKAFIQKKYGLSDKEYNRYFKAILAKLKAVRSKDVSQLSAVTYRKADKKTRIMMDATRRAFLSDNQNNSAGNYTAYGMSFSDILSVGADGAAVGGAFGGGIGAIGGAKGATIGAAIGAAVGASIGMQIGNLEELYEEFTGEEEGN